jgi:hypothetical protein
VEVCTIVVIVELVMKGVVDVRVVSVVTPVKNVLTKNSIKTLYESKGFFYAHNWPGQSLPVG